MDIHFKNTVLLFVFLYIGQAFAMGINSLGGLSEKSMLFVLGHPHLYLTQTIPIIGQLFLPLIAALIIAFISKIFKRNLFRVFNYSFLILGLLMIISTILSSLIIRGLA